MLVLVVILLSMMVMIGHVHTDYFTEYDDTEKIVWRGEKSMLDVV